MKVVGYILVGFVVIAAAQAAIAAFAMAVTLLFLWGLIAHPETAIPLLLFLLLWAALDRWPLATVAAGGVLLGALLIASRVKRARAAAERPAALLPPPHARPDGE